MLKNIFSNSPLFLLLLPLFFLAHLLNDYFRVLHFYQLNIAETYWYLGVSLVLFIAFSVRKPVIRRMALWVFLLQFLFFFFGPLRAFLEENIPALSKYSVILSLLLLILVVAGIWLMRSKIPFINTYRYLNIVLLVLLSYELLMVSLLYATDGKIKTMGANYPISKEYTTCDTCQKPDIYFLVFDMYANSKVLKSFWNYDNALDTYLDSAGFYRAKNSTSNYNYTVFSIGSLFNMDYHAQNITYTNAFRSSSAMLRFQDNELSRILQKEGYEFRNYSWFYLHADAPRVAPFVLTDPKELIAAQTFWFRFRTDVGWKFSFLQKKVERKELLTPFFLKECTDNLERVRKSYEGIRAASADSSGKPVFLYAHFLMPHAPFLFDSTGRLREQMDWLSTSHDYYLQQLKYTNSMIRDLTTHLIKEAKRPRIIIVQSDHGYRNYNAKDNLPRSVEFDNLNALYFPDRNYSGLYDSISNVNTFRVVMNRYFNTRLPLLKDTSIYLGLK